MADAVKIEGFREFRQNLRALDRDLGKAVRLAFNDAADLVVQEARPKVPSRSGRARGSVRAQSTQTMARVSGGGSRAPYYPWLDFGGQIGSRSGKAVGRRGRRPWVGKDGRYIYPAYTRNRGRFVEVMQDGLVKVARQAGFEVE